MLSPSGVYINNRNMHVAGISNSLTTLLYSNKFKIVRGKLREREERPAAKADPLEGDIQRKEAERRRLMDEVDRKRRDRKKAEQERRAEAERQEEVERREEQERRRAKEAARIRNLIERPGGVDKTPRAATSGGREKLKDADDTPKNEGDKRCLQFIKDLSSSFQAAVLWIRIRK